jgi:hypothetical protein
MTNKYENVVEEFKKRNCKLLNTNEEYIEILKSSKNFLYKLNYIASCGHEHIVFYNVFKSRGTGIICPTCKNKETGSNKKKLMQNNEISKIYTTEQESKFTKNISEILQNDFEVIKAFDGCNVDLIFRPKNIIKDEWVGIQVKTARIRYLTYSFHLHKTYKNCLLLFYCCEDENMWLIPENTISDQTKISIGYNKSKYNTYKINKDTIFNKLNEYYQITSKFTFEELDTPINIYQQREKEFRKFREEKIDFINFKYDNMEATVYDFKIGNLKIQEKVTKISDDNKCMFQLCKNNGRKNGKQNQKQYDIGDNDFYWLNCDNKKTFFVIPESVLIDKGLIGNNAKASVFFKITVKELLHKNSLWLQSYMFNYEDLDKERLLTTLHI